MRSKLLIAAAVVATTFMFPASAWAAVAFETAVNYGAGDGPQSVAVGDVNGDGKPDLVTANFLSDDVSVLIGNGDGTFGTATPFAAGDSPSSVAIGDLNGDGKLDLVTANANSHDVSVLIGNGDGTFLGPANLSGGGTSPGSVAIGDFDGDSKLDLAIAHNSIADIGILLGNGDGTFLPAVTHFTIGNPKHVAIGDLNADTFADLAVTNVGGEVSVLLGDGVGGFLLEIVHIVGGSLGTLAIGDVNGDGKPDLAVAIANSAALRVLLGNGDGTVDDGEFKTVGSGPEGVAISDLDADGFADIVTANVNDDNVSVLSGNGDGTFDDKVDFPVVGNAPLSVAVADLDGDGKPDVVSANGASSNVSVLLNPSEFTTGPTATISGTVRQGQTLTADEGTPVPMQDSFTYKWFADGVEIVGETAKTLLLTSAQVGKKISVTVTAIKAGLNDASDTSPETVPVVGIFTPGPKASITGTLRVGSTLTARTGSPSPTPTSFTYRWFADGKLLGTTAKTLKLTSTHHGKRIQVRVAAIKAGFLTASNLSPATARVSSLQAKIISLELNDYTVRRGQRVFADIERLAPGEPWSIVLDGKTLVRGMASSKGTVLTSFVVPSNATLGIRTIRAYGKFADRTDPDRITVR